MKVIATSIGYFGDRLISVGQTFDVPDDSADASWFKPVNGAEKTAAKTATKEPSTKTAAKTAN